MSEAQPIPPEIDIDDALKQTLAAAFGEEAISFLDDDDDSDEISAEVLASFAGETQSTSSDSRPRNFEANDDDSPLMRYVKELTNAVYADGLASLPNGDHLPSNEQQTMSRAPRFVVFTIGDQQFGVPLSDVREIARYPSVTVLPRTPFWLRGIANLRGQILSVTDLRNLLQIPSESPAVGEKIIVVYSRQNAASTAIVADRILGIRSFDDEQGELADLSCPVATIASGTATIDQATTVLIDPDRLFGSPEFLAFTS